MTVEKNTKQIAYRNDAPGQRWVTHDTELDAMHAPVSEKLFQFLRPQPGDRVLDIGCGAGTTSVAAAGMVGPDGSVLGVDVSSPLLLRAARRVEAHGLRNVALEHVDAQSHPFEPGTFDLAISRFGTMFFDDPVRAFSNVAKALRPGAPMVFAAWAGAEVNPWFSLAKQVAQDQLGTVPPEPPTAPGPLAFADAPRVIALLAAAGLTDIAAVRTDLDLELPGGPEVAAGLAIHVGPASRILRARNGTAADRKKMIETLTRAFEKYGDNDTFRIPAAIYLFTARVALAGTFDD